MIQLLKAGNDFRAQWVEVNISNQLQQIRFFLAENRFVSVLKQMTVPMVSAIVVHSIPGEQPLHYLGNRNSAGYQQQVEVVRNQRPGKAWRCRFPKDIAQSSDKIVAIRIILEYRFTCLQFIDKPMRNPVDAS
jgi:hypothetical protein